MVDISHKHLYLGINLKQGENKKKEFLYKMWNDVLSKPYFDLINLVYSLSLVYLKVIQINNFLTMNLFILYQN